MKYLTLIATACAVGSAVQVHASLYEIAYTQVGETFSYGSPTPGTTTDATGWLDIVGNTVVAGSLTVTGTGPGNGTYTLLPFTASDSLIQYDNVWPIDTGYGLAWSLSGVPGNSPEMNMWSTGGGEYGQPGGYYALWGGPNPDSSLFSVETYGTLSVTAVPEASTIVPGALLLLPLGASGLRILRKKTLSSQI